MQVFQHMYLSHTVLNWLLVSGGIFVSIIGIGELFVPKIKPINLFAFALCTSFGLAILIYLAQSLDLSHQWPQILYLYFPLELFCGPLFFFYFTLLIEKNFPIYSPYLLLFIPPLGATALMLPYFFEPSAVKILQIPFYKTSNAFFHVVYLFIYHNSETILLANILLFIIRAGLKFRKKIRKEAKNIFIIILFAILFFGAILFYLWVNFFPSVLIRKLSIFVSILMVFPLYFFYKRNPDFFNSIPVEQSDKYKHSTKLVGKDTEEILSRLEVLMVKKKLYTDNELTLKSLSDKLGLSPHQLSEILNDRLGTNLSHYVNGFRIESAKKMLCESPNLTVLEIAFDCGFGSKSSFNSAFSQSTGMTPSAWRHLHSSEHTKYASDIHLP